MTNAMALPGTEERPARTSALAITSLILSLVVCCPLSTIAGIAVGGAALFVTRGGRMRGRWLAFVAIVLGVTATVLQGALVEWAWRTIYEPFVTGPQAALRDGMRGDGAGFQRAFVATISEGNTPEAAQAFCEELKRRYGSFESSQMDQTSAGSRPPSAVESFSTDYLLEFERGRVRSTARMQIVDATGQFSLRFEELTIHDDVRGALHYPPPKESTEGDNGKR